MDIKLIENNLYVTPTKPEDQVVFEEVDIENMNCIRIFPSGDSDTLHVQLRATQSLKGRQKKRNVVATVKISIDELESIMKMVKEHMLTEA